MYSVLYNFSIQILGLFIQLIGLINPKAKLRAKGQNHWKSLPKNEAPLAWFHCASLGEFEQGRSVLEAFRIEFPEHKILLTFFSPSGYEIRKSYKEADFITYLPLDTPSNAKKFIKHFKPSIAFFVKYEFWRNFTLELNRKSTPLLSFSTIFRATQIYFRPWGALPRQTLFGFKHFFVQNNESAQLLNAIAIKNVTIAGDTRYDRVKSNKDSCKSIAIIEEFKGNSDTIIIGSAWQEDMEVLIPIINDSAFENKKFIIAPHEINPQEIDRWSKSIKCSVERYSTFDRKSNAKVLFIDNVGMLSAIYQYGYAAYVGGAFGKGLHNILEAAVFGISVYFGNRNYEKFQEANELISLETARPIGNSIDLKNALLELENPETKELIKEKNAKFIDHHLGATEKIISFCSTHFKK